MNRSRADVVSFVETCVLVLWLGAALFFAAVVAPAAFTVLPTTTLAGALVGRVLPTLFVTGIVAALLVLGLEIGAPRPAGRVRAVGAGVMLIACAVAQFVIGSRIEQLRAVAGSPIGTLSRDDPRRTAFGRLHALSVAALGVAMIAAATTAAAGARQPAARS
jgi:hypothetical protein